MISPPSAASRRERRESIVLRKKEGFPKKGKMCFLQIVPGLCDLLCPGRECSAPPPSSLLLPLLHLHRN
jgi:hypothetical protein